MPSFNHPFLRTRLKYASFLVTWHFHNKGVLVFYKANIAWGFYIVATMAAGYFVYSCGTYVSRPIVILGYCTFLIASILGFHYTTLHSSRSIDLSHMSSDVLTKDAPSRRANNLEDWYISTESLS